MVAVEYATFSLRTGLFEILLLCCSKEGNGRLVVSGGQHSIGVVM